MTSYLLLEGQHLEPSGVDSSTKYMQGERFESDQDWYAERWPEKFRKLESKAETGHVWNPQRETLEAFTRRMQEQGIPPGTKQEVPHSPATGDEEMIDLESLSVKDLQAQAAGANIDLKGATSKNDIIRTIKAALVANSSMDM